MDTNTRYTHRPSGYTKQPMKKPSKSALYRELEALRTKNELLDMAFSDLSSKHKALSSKYKALRNVSTAILSTSLISILLGAAAVYAQQI